MKNIKSIFFITLTLLLIVGISSVTAADNTTTTDIISDTTTTTTPEIQTTPTYNDNNDNVITEETKEIQKSDKNLKTATKTVEVNNMDEFTTAMNNAVQDSENEEYVINLNEGTYQISGTLRFHSGQTSPNIIINGNNQQFTADTTSRTLIFNNSCTMIINNLDITYKINNYLSNITLNNSNIETQITNKKNMIIDNSILPYTVNEANLTLVNIVCNQGISNKLTTSNLTLVDSVLNSTITNNGVLNLNNVTLGTKFALSGTGTVNSDNPSQLLPYMSVYNGNYTLENVNLTDKKTNNGNLTIINCNILGDIEDFGNLTIINSNASKSVRSWGQLVILDSNISSVGCSLNSSISNSTIGSLNCFSNSNISVINSKIENSITVQINSTLNVADDVEFGENCDITIYGDSIINISDENKIIPFYTRYNGTYTLENMNINKSKTNYGNLTLRNCVLNASISNDGNLTICDDVIFGDKAAITGRGTVIANDTTKIAPYLNYYNGTYLLENITITSSKENQGNLTIRNATINSYIYNYGNLTICDDVDFGPQGNINDYGQIITNDTTKIAPYLSNYDGDYTLENTTITTSKTNQGKLTIKNSTLTSSGSIRNDGEIIVKNSTLNGTISSYHPGTSITIEDDVIFGNRLSITGNTRVIINDTNKIAPYLNYYNNNYTLENITITNIRNNTGNLTIHNSTLNNKFGNSGNLTIENSTIKGIIENYGTLTLNESTLSNTIENTGTVILGDNLNLTGNFIIRGTGKVISSDINKYFPYINEFTGETTIDLSNYYKSIQNSGNLTIENSTLNNPITNNVQGKIILKNTTTMLGIANEGTLELNNATINNPITNRGILIISDDTIFGANFKINGDGQIIINDTQRIADYLSTYTSNITLNNKTIDTPKVNQENLTLNNCTISSTITNNGRIIIDDNTIFTQTGKITGNGEIITNNITRLLPYIDTINGNHTITDTTLNKTYKFNGNVTLNNCNITQPNNSNFGTLTLNNCTVNVGEGNNFIDNFGNLIIRKDTEIIGEINNLGGETSYSDAPKVYVVNNRTVSYFFDNTGLTSMVKEGDTLDFQGTISGVSGVSFTFNKPINIITTTNDGKIDNYGVVNFTKESSGSNVTGLYTHNTQFYVWNADHIVFDNISNVVEDKQVGWGVGQTSIRENSSYITVKNSYFYTKDNGGSSTLVLAWADNCIIENNTIEGEGNIGNMLYITTYNVEIPTGIIFNSHNKLLNNTINGPTQGAAICYGISYCGIDNLIDGNIINYSGTGITEQWGSGIDGVMTEESAFESRDNIISNNKLYGGCGINAGDIIYNNYMEGQLAAPGKIYNNTASRAQILPKTIEFTNNTILGQINIQNNVNSTKITNNTIKGNINIPNLASNITITGNNITGTINLNASNNIITDNQITSPDEYTIIGKRSPANNTITDNYLIANTLTGDKSVNLDKETNTIENNMPYENILKVDTTEFTAGQSATITASIYYGSEVNSTISKGKVTFKVNGKTLKDASGKVIYAKVVNGVATVENYLVPDTWKNGSTIQAVYSGSADCEKLTSEKTDITIVAEEAKITTEDVTATAGSKITLKATITDNNKVINTGKVVFKINGKTVKDENGKVIYAKVVNNQVEFEYTLPDSYKAGSYNITATFISADYERLEDSKTLNVN